MLYSRRMKVSLIPFLAVFLITILRFLLFDSNKVVDDYALDFTPITFSPNETLNFLILVVLNSNSDANEYTFPLNTLKCYAQVQNYSIKVVKDSEYSAECNQTDYMFKRHCITAQFLPSADWILFLDADISVVNPERRIEEYIDPNATDTELIMYDRFDGFEIAMGSYIAHNTEWTKNFLMEFANYERKLPPSFHGTDNGAIHAFVIEKLMPEARSPADPCFKIWETSTGFEDLFLYEACIRYHLGNPRNIGPLRIVPKGKGWVRDGWITKSKWSLERDFMLHGHKTSDRRFWTGISWLDSFFASFNHRFIWYTFLSNELDPTDVCVWDYVPGLKVDRKTIENSLKERYRKVERHRWRTLARLSFH